MSNLKLTKLIEKKRNGDRFSPEEIMYFVQCVVKLEKDGVPVQELGDRSQIGAMLMAIYFRGLDADETYCLTEAMMTSGYVFSWPDDMQHLVVDKHSTGGVGDKVSLVLAPALAALGLKVPMISGRSLGHTGGTLDKLESIPGFRVYLTKEEMYAIIREVGCCIVGQTEDCVPADKILYHCRDITATVDCPPLIVASIASKKLSESPAALVYDVKFGKGSIFKSKKEAVDTAHKLIGVSKSVKASAVLTSMENPLGEAIGNALEVLEAIDCLKGGGPEDVLEVTCTLGSELLRLVKGCSKEEGYAMISTVLQDGRALEKFKSVLLHQGVSEEIAQTVCYGEIHSVLGNQLHPTVICYDGKEGYVQEVDPLILANWWKEESSQSLHNSDVGIKLLKTVGEHIQAGDAWARIYHDSTQLQSSHLERLQQAILVGSERKTRIICYEIVS